MVAAMLPSIYCPSAPMLKSPALNENATLMPVKMMGVLLSMTLNIYFGLENMPFNKETKALTGLYPTKAKMTPDTMNPHNIANMVEVMGFFKNLMNFSIVATSRHE